MARVSANLRASGISSQRQCGRPMSTVKRPSAARRQETTPAGVSKFKSERPAAQNQSRFKAHSNPTQTRLGSNPLLAAAEIWARRDWWGRDKAQRTTNLISETTGEPALEVRRTLWLLHYFALVWWRRWLP